MPLLILLYLKVQGMPIIPLDLEVLTMYRTQIYYDVLQINRQNIMTNYCNKSVVL